MGISAKLLLASLVGWGNLDRGVRRTVFTSVTGAMATLCRIPFLLRVIA